jgi:hypothetical protein
MFPVNQTVPHNTLHSEYIGKWCLIWTAQDHHTIWSCGTPGRYVSRTQAWTHHIPPRFQPCLTPPIPSGAPWTAIPWLQLKLYSLLMSQIPLRCFGEVLQWVLQIQYIEWSVGGGYDLLLPVHPPCDVKCERTWWDQDVRSRAYPDGCHYPWRQKAAYMWVSHTRRNSILLGNSHARNFTGAVLV